MKTIAEHLTAQNKKINEHTNNIKKHESRLSNLKINYKKIDGDGNNYLINKSFFGDANYCLMFIHGNGSSGTLIYDKSKKTTPRTCLYEYFDNGEPIMVSLQLSDNTNNNLQASIGKVSKKSDSEKGKPKDSSVKMPALELGGTSL